MVNNLGILEYKSKEIEYVKYYNSIPRKGKLLFKNSFNLFKSVLHRIRFDLVQQVDVFFIPFIVFVKQSLNSLFP